MYENVEKVYRLYYPDLFLFLVKHCPNTDIIDDIIQNTFLEALKGIENYQGISSMKTWLFGIAKHQLYRHYRNNKVQMTNINDIPEANLVTMSDYSDKLMVQHILETIEKFRPPHDEIMRLRLIDELSFKEIGLRIGYSENYCRVNFYRAKEKLRKEYGDEIM